MLFINDVGEAGTEKYVSVVHTEFTRNWSFRESGQRSATVNPYIRLCFGVLRRIALCNSARAKRTEIRNYEIEFFVILRRNKRVQCFFSFLELYTKVDSR